LPIEAGACTWIVASTTSTALVEGCQRGAACHGKHLAVEELALELGSAFDPQILGFAQPTDWLSQRHNLAQI
jgi:hypothetical protein